MCRFGGFFRFPYILDEIYNIMSQKLVPTQSHLAFGLDIWRVVFPLTFDFSRVFFPSDGNGHEFNDIFFCT